MADGDYYARHLAPKWRKVARTLEGGHDVELVASLAREAYAETMRLAHGVPGLNALADALAAAASTGERAQWAAVHEQVRREARHHANTEQAALAGQALLENDGERLRGLSRHELAGELAYATGRRIAQHHLARCRQGDLPATFEGVAKLHAFERDVIGQMDLRGHAAQMLSHEDGKGYTAPSRHQPAAGTKALLGRSLVS